MRSAVDVSEVEKLIAAGAQVVEVLPRSEYEEQHLPGALSIPLQELPTRSGELDPDKPVVVYCYDTQCDMSPRAAAQLDHLGFAEVYDFVTGKMAWLGSGLPSEGRQPDAERAGALATDVPTCGPEETVAGVFPQLAEQGLCVVVDDDRVVLGALGPSVLELPPESIAGEVMHAAPLTVRPDTPRAELRELLGRIHRDHVLVTTLAGELLGWVRGWDLGEPPGDADRERETLRQEAEMDHLHQRGADWVDQAQR